LNKVLPHFSSSVKNTDKNHTLVVIDKNNPVEKYQYYATRIQMGSLQNRLCELRLKYSEYKIFLQKDNEPNYGKLYNLMKEDMCEDIEFEENHFNTSLVKNVSILCIQSIHHNAIVNK
jgi:biopolymer transport protein ExbD